MVSLQPLGSIDGFSTVSRLHWGFLYSPLCSFRQCPRNIRTLLVISPLILGFTRLGWFSLMCGGIQGSPRYGSPVRWNVDGAATVEGSGLSGHLTTQSFSLLKRLFCWSRGCACVLVVGYVAGNPVCSSRGFVLAPRS